jgi:glycosyltransferase involved in cell wall biosynthesis
VFLHVSGPLVPLALALLGKRFVRDKRIVAQWFWELDQLPSGWNSGVRFVHEICVNTRFVFRAVSVIARDRPVRVVPLPLPAPSRAPVPITEHRPFTALVVFNVASSFARKNPCAAIHAFRRAFGDDRSTRLLVKYCNADHWPQSLNLLRQAVADATNIELMGETLSREKLDDLFECSDLILSLHRSEGLGRVIAEGMLRGLPVIGTDWSGSTDFLTLQTGIPIGFDLVPAVDPQGTYNIAHALWAEPRIDEAVSALRLLRSDTELRKRLGDTAAGAAAHLFDPAAYAKAIATGYCWKTWCRRTP